MTLFLIGYMGSGKSVIGKKLAETLNYNYIDFDEFIENREERSVKTIFESKGEIYFRNAESNYLKEIIPLKNTVISLGGGTPCYGTNLKTLLDAKNVRCIYLKSTIATLCDRLFLEKDKRPLISHLDTKEALCEFIGKHLFERAPFYEQSHLSIKTDGKSIIDVVEALNSKLF